MLAEDLAARLTQPPFDASAMDGYAVRAADVASLPATLKLIGASLAGAGFAGRVGRGEAVRIFTGAPVPRGADTIVIQENTDEAGGMVRVKDAAPGRHIRPRGQDFKQGEVLLSAGTRLGPRELMLAAAMNQAELPVRRKPKVAILATGDEVVPPGSELAKDQIVSSVPCGLAALIERHGGEAMSLGIAKDEAESLVTLARAGRAADILLTIGGASVGDRDLVASALKPEGLEVDFWKIAMRPGKPLLYGRLGGQRVLGLPGNPVSAFVYGSRLPGADAGADARARPDIEARARGGLGRGAASQCRAGTLHGCGVGMARGRHARRASPALAGLLARRRACPRRLPHRAGAAGAGAAAGRAREDHSARLRLRGRKPESRQFTLPAASYRILWHSRLRNTNRTDKLFMICTGGRRKR